MTLRSALTWFALAALSMLPWSTALAQAPSPRLSANASLNTAIQQCSDRVGDDGVSLSDLESRCPQLRAALAATGIQPLLMDGSASHLDRHSLRQLLILIRPPSVPVPQVAALSPILRNLHGPVRPPVPWWRQLLEWLSEKLTPKLQPDTAPPWLAAVLRLVPRLKWLWIGLLCAALLALPVLVIMIVRRELRAMGRRSIDERAVGEAATDAGPLASRLAMLHRTPAGQRPAQLFAMLIARLVAAGRLSPDRSLTHREVVRRAVLEDREQRRLIEALAQVSERQLYADAVAGGAGLDELLSRGEDLYTIGWSRPPDPAP